MPAPVGVDGPARQAYTLADLAAHARRELEARRRTAFTADAIGKWERIVTLLATGECILPLDPAETATTVLAELTAVAHVAVQQRADQAARNPSAELDERLRALRAIRSLLLRSAIRAGAQLPSFDNPHSSQKDIAA